MFINSKKCFEISEGDKKLVIPRNFIGSIPDWAANHWLVQAAIRDGSIATPENTADKTLEAADAAAGERAGEYDIRPEDGLDGSTEAAEEPEKQPGRKGKEKAQGGDGMDGRQFHGVAAAAANTPAFGEAGSYTAGMFLEDFPQFARAGTEPRESLVPDGILGAFIGNANQSILPGRYFEMWRYAAGLYVAHFSTLYLKTYSDGSATAAQAAGSGQQTGLISAASMGDTSIKDDNEAITLAMAKWGSWNATQYGQQLISMARMIGMGGSYVI